MEKIKEYLLEGTLFAIIIQSLIVGPNLPCALVAVGILGAMAFKSFLAKEKELKIQAVDMRIAKVEEEVKVKLAETSNKVDLITMKLGIVDARKGLHG